MEEEIWTEKWRRMPWYIKAMGYAACGLAFVVGAAVMGKYGEQFAYKIFGAKPKDDDKIEFKIEVPEDLRNLAEIVNRYEKEHDKKRQEEERKERLEQLKAAIEEGTGYNPRNYHQENGGNSYVDLRSGENER